MDRMSYQSACRAARACALALLVATLIAPAGMAGEAPVFRQIGGKRLKLQTGRVQLAGEAVQIDVPSGMVFLAGDDARFIIELMWRNRLDARVIGLIVPADTDFARDPAAPPPEQDRNMRLDPEAMPVMPPAYSADAADGDQWATVIAWNEGHVRERMVRNLDPDRILAAMRESLPRANAAPGGAAVPRAELLGWAVPPSYDAGKHALTWAKQLGFYYGEATGPRRLDVATQINHCTYLLGARGVFEFTTVADASDLAEAVQASGSILARTTILPGHRYEDFRPGSDPEYDGDLGARIAGGEDPGNLHLAAKSRYALWTAVSVILVILAGLSLLGVSRRWRLLSLPATPGLCPRCERAIQPGAARCPACGASTIARSDSHA